MLQTTVGSGIEDVPVELLSRLYSRCFAFVMPSLQEGFGLVYLEAMNYAKPCLGCSDQGTEDVIVPGETGVLVRDPGDDDELAGGIESLLADPIAVRGSGQRPGAARRQPL